MSFLATIGIGFLILALGASGGFLIGVYLWGDRIRAASEERMVSVLDYDQYHFAATVGNDAYVKHATDQLERGMPERVVMEGLANMLLRRMSRQVVASMVAWKVVEEARTRKRVAG